MTNESGWIEILDLTKVQLEYRDAFAKAQNKLNAILINQTAHAVNVEGRIIRGVLIDASTKAIDGDQGVLGRAGPTFLRQNTTIPVAGIMEFDTADLGRLKEKGELEDVVLHEMFHVLGAGTLWKYKNILIDDETDDPKYVGPHGLAEYHALLNNKTATSVPVANTGGPGTRNGHWREETFGIELNTGFLNGTHRPLSKMSIAALADLGYTSPNLAEADAYTLPSTEFIKSLQGDATCCSRMLRPEYHVVIEV